MEKSMNSDADRAARTQADSQPAMTPETVYAAIAHGDEEHRAWLLSALRAVWCGEAVPPVASPIANAAADSQPAPVPTSATGGDWTQPTTVALRLGDAMQLLCGGKRPPDDMVQQWLDNTSESLQEFAASNGPAWAQGIGLIDAALVMVDQPTEITAIDNPDRDHEHRAARAPADSVTAPVNEAVAYLDIGAGGYIDLGTDLSEEALSRLPKGRHAATP